MGVLGERIAARFLTDRGATVLERNIRIDRGELDLVVAFDGRRVAVEVKTATGDTDPVYHFDTAKSDQVRSLASRRGIHRVDYVGVAITPMGALVRWLPAAG